MMIRVILGWCRARGGDMASFQGSEKVANVSMRESENLSTKFLLGFAGIGIARWGKST
jgi:hypothetical protein